MLKHEQKAEDLDNYVDSVINRMLRRLKTLSKTVYKQIQVNIIDKLEQDDDGNIKLTDKNMVIINRVTKRLTGVDFSKLADATKAELSLIIDKASPYFESFKIAADKIDEAKKTVYGKLKRHAKQLDDITIQHKQALVYKKRILTQVSRGRTRKELNKYVKGLNRDDIAFKHIKTQLRDAVMEVDRHIVNDMANELDFNQYFRYMGNLVDRSRDFCDARNRKCFTREQVLNWENMEWQGKSANYDPFINVGGYNCRHRLMPISEEMYLRLKSQGL